MTKHSFYEKNLKKYESFMHGLVTALIFIKT